MIARLRVTTGVHLAEHIQMLVYTLCQQEVAWKELKLPANPSTLAMLIWTKHLPDWRAALIINTASLLVVAGQTQRLWNTEGLPEEFAYNVQHLSIDGTLGQAEHAVFTFIEKYYHR